MTAPYSNGLGSTWGLKATMVARTPPNRWTGRGIRIALLDSGIDLTHRDLQPRIAATKSFVPGCDVQDGIGHGTHCAGTAVGFADRSHRRYGVACNAQLYVARVLDDTGRTDAAIVIAGMDWALSRGCDVIFLALGTFDSAPSEAFEAAGRRALEKGCLVLAAAGNMRSRIVVQPANARSIMAIGAIDNWSNVADFSAGGSGGGTGVDLVAPGVNVYSTAPLDGYATRDGTSMAAAHAAGVAALWAEAEGVRGSQLWKCLVARARPLPSAANREAPGLVTAP